MFRFPICTLIIAAAASVSAAAASRQPSASSVASPSSGPTEMAVGVADLVTVTNGQALSAMFSMNQSWIQAYLGVYQTKGNFDFAVGGAYKYTLVGTRATGFHVGPGVSLGTVNDDFAWAVYGTAGGHFSFHEHFMVAVDAGPMVTHTKNNTNFRLMPLGNLLGLSAYYVF